MCLVWVVCGKDLCCFFGGGVNDGLLVCGEFGICLCVLVDEGWLELYFGFGIYIIECMFEGLCLLVVDGIKFVIEGVDEIIVLIGVWFDFLILCEFCVWFDLWFESIDVFVLLIDFNEYSCGIVCLYGYCELVYFEFGFYVIGVKSYGCVFNFLMVIGYE